MPKEVKPVDVNVKGGKPRTMGRSEVAGSTTETIQSHQRPGRDVHGIDRNNVHTTARTQRHRDGEAYRAGLRDSTK